MARKTSTRSASSSKSPLTIKPYRPPAENTKLAAVPATRETAAYVRLAHPNRYGLYFTDKDAVNPWVEKDYTRWTITEWEGKFGKGVDSGDDRLRKWEFFGYTIPLYDDPKT